jgi:AcrR family transcriptional regulator
MIKGMSEPSTDPNDVDNWKKDNTRQAILAAARRLSAREGVDAVTLGRVAAEAGFAATAVYSYFVTKDDLHLALVADDLETIADVMREGAKDEAYLPLGESPDTPNIAKTISDVPAASDPRTASVRHSLGSPQSITELEQVLGVVRQADEEFLADTKAEPEPIPDAFPEEAVQGATGATPQFGATAKPELVESTFKQVEVRQIEPMVEQKSDALELSKVAPQDIADSILQLQSRIHRLERGTVHGELVRRLDSIEKGLAVLEGRMERLEQDLGGAREKFEDEHGRLTNQMAEALGTSHRSLLERNEQHALLVADLRTYVKELTGRIGTIESWLARKAREATANDGRGEQQFNSHAEVSGRMGASATTGQNNSRRTKRSKRILNLRSLRKQHKRWAVGLGLLLLITLGALGTAIGLHMMPSTFVPTSQLDAIPAGTTIDARLMAMAKAGNANAELVVGLKLLNGDRTATNIPGAAYWLRQAALQSQPVAEYWLGTLYERGQGMPKSLSHAFQWYAKAAAAGNAKAMYRLGVGFAEGWGGAPDFTSAAKWFAAAAQYGVIDAQFNLAVLYERGSGVDVSLKNAFTWYTIAASQGDAQSKVRLDVLAAHMSSADVAAAQAAANTFKAQPPPPAANDTPDPAELAARL